MVTIQPITASYAGDFKTVRLRALLDTPTAFGSTHAKEVQLSEVDWVRRAGQWNSDRSMAFLAYDDRDACGIAGGFLDTDDRTKAHLVSMWVAPPHRTRGIGRLLVNAVSDWARSRQAKTLCLMVTSNNSGAQRFYASLGFVMTGRTEPYPNDPALIEHEMLRSIAAE